MARLLKHDFQLAGKGYLLAQTGRARSWRRQGQPDTPIRINSRTEEQAKYGGVDPQLDYPEVWDDWSGGYGHAYQDGAAPNTYHWSENFDARTPRQLVHCQNPRILKGTSSYSLPESILMEGVSGIFDGAVIGSSGAFFADPNQLWVFSRNGYGQGFPNPAGDGFDFVNTILFYPDNAASHGANEQPFLYPPAIYGSHLIWGVASGSNFWMVDGGSIDHYPNIPGYHFAVAGNQLWRACGPKEANAIYLQNCGNPAGVASPANWGATYAIGNYQAPIKSLIGVDDQIFAGTPQGLFAGDQTGTFINVLSQLGQQPHPDNCRDLTIFEGAVVVPHIAGVFAYRPQTGQVEDLTPARSDRSPVTGNIRAVKAYGRYLYGGLYTGSRSYLLAGERKGQGIVWHTLNRFPHTTKVGQIYIDGFSSYSITRIPNNFWASTEASIDPSGTAPCYWWPIPSLDGNPLSGSPGFSANYVGSARIDFGSTDWNAPSTPKVYRSVELWSENLKASAQWADVYYTIDEGTRIKLGSVATSPKNTLFFSSGEGSFVTGQSIRMSLESFTASAGVTPVYRALVLRGSLQPRYTDEIEAVVRIADDMVDRQRQPMGRSAATMLQELRDLGNPDRSGLQAHTLIDLAGATWQVKLLGPPQEEEVWIGQGDAKRPEIAAAIRMAVLSFTGA